MASDSEITSRNDPNFAVICSFLEIFGENCGLDIINTAELQKSLENTHEITSRLKELHLKLLRRALRNVHTERWEKALIKFCHQQSYYQDAWELERFGYKKASVTVKLKILKNLLAYQFVCHTKFKNDINKLESKCLRLEPMGKDCKGRLYWVHIDKRANLRLYREDQDEETWTLIASDKESYIEALNILKNGGDQNDANISGALNEDSNSIEDLPSRLKKYSIETNNSTSSEKSDNSSAESEIEESETKEVKKEKKLKKDFEHQSKETNKEHIKLKIKNIVNNKNDSSEEKCIKSFEVKDNQLVKSDTLPKKRLKVEADSKSSEVSSSSTIGDEIEENVMIFKGDGDGAECDSCPFYVGEEISDPVLFFWGEGMGYECLTGNPNVESSDENEKKDSENLTRNEKNETTEKEPSDDITQLQTVEESSKGPIIKQDNGMVQKSCDNKIETSDLIAENKDDSVLNLKVSTATLPVTKRILLNIPKPDSTANNSGEETSSVHTKLWSVDAMCNDSNQSKDESIDHDENFEEKINSSGNSVLPNSNNSNNINIEVKQAKDEEENIAKKDFKTDKEKIEKKCEIISENKKTCTESESPRLIDNVSPINNLKGKSVTNNTKTKNKDPTLIDEQDLNSPEAKKIIDQQLDLEANSDADNHFFNNVKEIKIFNENAHINIGDTSADKNIILNMNESIGPKSELQNKITGKHKVNNKVLTKVPDEIKKNLEVLSKKPKLDLNTEIINAKKKKKKKYVLDQSNEKEEAKLKDTKINSKITKNSVVTKTSSGTLKHTANKHSMISTPLNKCNELENTEEVKTPKDKIKLKTPKVPETCQDDDIKSKKTCDVDSVPLLINLRSTLRSKEIKHKNFEPKDDLVKSKQIEICHPISEEPKVVNIIETSKILDRRKTGRKRLNANLKIDKFTEKNSLKRIRDSDGNRKRSHNESESLSDEETQEPKVVKKIKMKTRKIVRVKQKVHIINETNSSDEDLTILQKKGKPLKALKAKVQESQKEISKKMKDKAEDKNAKEKIKAEELDPLDISDQSNVRQSRRIAQIKIKEEATRRQMEEVALRELKEQHKKKGGKKKTDIDWRASSPDHSSGSEINKGLKKKGKLLKKEKLKDEKSWKTGWHSSSGKEHTATESDGPLEELEYHDDGGDDDYLKEKSDHEFSPESENDSPEVTPVRRARTLRKSYLEKPELSKDDESEEDGACGACGGQGQPDWILLCDDCNAGRHAACLKPILFLIPEGHWYCPPCDEKRLIKSLEDKLVEYENLLEAVKNEPVEVEEEKLEKASDSDGSHSSAGSDDTDSSSDDSDDGKIYRLRERKQLPISYHFKEYDQLISSAIKEEYHEKTSSAGNQGRGKDISTIIEADKEEKEKAKLEAQQKGSENVEGNAENINEGSEDEEAKKRRERARKAAMRRRPRKLNSLEVLSEDDDDNSDEDFKETGSCSNSSSEESNAGSDSDSGSHSSDSMPLRRSQRDSNPTKRRKRIVESPELKKKRHNVIEDDTSSESSGSKAWTSSKKLGKFMPKMRFMSNKKNKKKKRKSKTTSGDDVPKMPKSRVRYGGLDSDSEASHDWSPAHRTRQLKTNYAEIPNTDSEAEAHKPSGKHMDSTDEYKEDSDSTDSDSDKAAKSKRDHDSSDTEKASQEKGNNDVERIINELECQKKAIVPLEKLPDDIALKFSPTKDVPENEPDSAVLCATSTPVRGRGARGGRGIRGNRGSSGGRGRGGTRRGSLNTSVTDGESNLDGSEIKSDDGSFTGDSIKSTKAKATLPPTPQQIERERKRQEREAKLAEREKKKQEKIKMKEEKSQLKEQKAKERDEKKQARLAFLENKKQKKLQDMEANETHENMNPMSHNPNIPSQFRNYHPQMPLHLRMPGPRMLRPQYPQHFFPRPGSERPMHPANFSPPPDGRNPVVHHGVHGPRPDTQQHYPINNFGPMQMAVAHRVRPPGMLGPRGELMNPIPIKSEPLDQMPSSPHEGRQVAPLNYAMDPRSSNASGDDANSPMHSDSEANPRPSGQTKGSIRALTPAELMAPGRNMSHGPVGMMERMAHRSLPYMNPPMRDDINNLRMPSDSPQKRRGRGPGKKTLARQVSNGGPQPRPSGGSNSGIHSTPSTSTIPEGTLSVAGSPQPFKPATDPPSIITRMPHMMPPPYRGSSMYGGNRPIYGSPSRPPLHMGMYRPHGSHPHDPSPSGGGPMPVPNPDRINMRPQYPPYPQGPYYPPQMPYHARYPPPSDLPHPHPHPHPLHPLHPQPHPAHSHPPPGEVEGQREDSSPRPEVSRSPLSPRPQLPTNTSPALSPRPSPHPSPHLSPGHRMSIKRSPVSSPTPPQDRSATPPRAEDRTSSKPVDGKAEKIRARVTSATRYPQGPYAPQFAAYGPYPTSMSLSEPESCPERSREYDPQNIGPPVPSASIQPLIPPDSPPVKPETEPETASKVEANEETSEFGGLVSYFSSQREDDIEE